jgi:hypothetical protein
MSDRQDDTSPILGALYTGRSDDVEALLAADPELDVFEAAAVGRTDRVQDLHDSNPSLASAWSGDGFTPLHLAAFFGHAAAAELLLERGAPADTVSRHAQIKVTPLQSAVAREGAADARVVQVLLEHGASPNARGEGGGTALHSAAANEDATIVSLLLARGADPLAPRDDGQTPVDLARAAGHNEVASLLCG